MIEVDGFQYHKSKTAFQKDRERQNLLAEHGYVVLRYYTKQILKELLLVVDQIASIERMTKDTVYAKWHLQKREEVQSAEGT